MWVNVNKLRDEMIKYFARYDHMAASRALGRSKFKIHFQNKKIVLCVAQSRESFSLTHEKITELWQKTGMMMGRLWYVICFFSLFLLSSIVLPPPKNISTMDVQNYTKSAS